MDALVDMAATTDNFITLVVHTPERAGHLAGILSFHGIANRLEEVEGDVDMAKKPVRVMVPLSSLPLALKITESGEDYSSAQIMIKMAGMSGSLLIPVDFSPQSMLAVGMGFDVAVKMGLKPVILHAWLGPDALPIQDQDDPFSPLEDEIKVEEARETNAEAHVARVALKKFEERVRNAVSAGKLPDIEFSTSLIEGVAEEVILEYCRLNSPSMVVMTTRSRERKESDLIGSVAAEVVDSCRVPVLTLPSNYEGKSLEEIEKLVMFCSLDKHDVMTLRSLMKSFNYPVCSVYLVPISEKVNESVRTKLHDLKSFFMANYPTARFHEFIANKEFCADIDALVSARDIGLMIVPNKKTNVFSRIFRPTLAHRCLFQHDMPMLFVPV